MILSLTDFTANIFYTVNLIVLLTCLFDRWSKKADQRASLMLLRIMVLMPLLALQYGERNHFPDIRWVASLFFTENSLALCFVILALQLQAVLKPGRPLARGFPWATGLLAGVVVAMGIGWRLRAPAFGWTAGAIFMPAYGQLYFSTLFTLLAALLMAWRLEAFWRALTRHYRRQYRYLVLGFLLIFGCLVWSTSYRLTYLHLTGDHLLLLAFLFLAAWLFIVYAVARHRLFSRRVFISRKVVYSAIVPTVFAFYLIGLGLLSLLIRSMGWTLPFVLQWLLIILGLMLIVAVAVRHKVRDRVKYFISTHFYLNKYEYRDVWLAFSRLLQDAVSETDVARALGQILQKCLYTRTILIWLGDRAHGFRLVDMEDDQGDTAADIASDDALVAHLQSGRFLYLAGHQEDPAVKALAGQKRQFFQAHDVVLAAPLLVGEQCVGLIGLGPEYTGGRYGRDDFDLLATLGSQAASALLAARNAEKLAHIRERSAWGILSAFVMHDIKNAATMLALVQQNAPHHIHDPAFQEDMLASIDDALNRMTKVQTRLALLKGEMAPVMDTVALAPFLQQSAARLSKKIPGLRLTVACAQTIQIRTDREFIYQILENLLLNAREADGDVRVDLVVESLSRDLVQLRLCDTGPGIPPEMLPTRLFEPFVTAKPKGSGIGLWQVKQLVEALGGTIAAHNGAGGGACFTIDLPAGAM